VGFWDYFTFRFLQGEAASDGGRSAGPRPGSITPSPERVPPEMGGLFFPSFFLFFSFFQRELLFLPTKRPAGVPPARLPTPLVVLARLDNEPTLLASVQLKEPES